MHAFSRGKKEKKKKKEAFPQPVWRRNISFGRAKQKTNDKNISAWLAPSYHCIISKQRLTFQLSGADPPDHG